MKSLLVAALLLPCLVFAQKKEENKPPHEKIRQRINYLEHVQCKYPDQRTDYNQGLIHGLYESLLILQANPCG